jgi:hypothetical protein
MSGRLVELFLAELITSSTRMAHDMDATVLQPSHLYVVDATNPLNSEGVSLCV